MKIELDTEANALYLYVRDGEVARTLEVEEGVYLDLDAEDRPLGLEFVYAEDFLDFLKRHGGRIRIPERVEDPENLSLA